MFYNTKISNKNIDINNYQDLILFTFKSSLLEDDKSNKNNNSEINLSFIYFMIIIFCQSGSNYFKNILFFINEENYNDDNNNNYNNKINELKKESGCNNCNECDDCINNKSFSVMKYIFRYLLSYTKSKVFIY